jgi:hypothetical protein
MALFFIDTATGQIATGRQLSEAGLVPEGEHPGPPWHRIQGSGDATTLWYAVMRRRERDVYMGMLCIRHSDYHASLVQSGWQEVPVDEIGPTRCRPAS